MFGQIGIYLIIRHVIRVRMVRTWYSSLNFLSMHVQHKHLIIPFVRWKYIC